ncbi:hypothetical protein SAMN02745194_04358 [Roseomonas rosea]|uniref:Uncharacterized protein n=1 Tax=Muricoccus roseus TaxID=198092 RepID=A0A1M6QBZ9_9PROT|nr:hypothetical protein SAMN02745194_04358 [Roseomonas rosea]
MTSESTWPVDQLRAVGRAYRAAGGRGLDRLRRIEEAEAAYLEAGGAPHDARATSSPWWRTWRGSMGIGSLGLPRTGLTSTARRSPCTATCSGRRGMTKPLPSQSVEAPFRAVP